MKPFNLKEYLKNPKRKLVTRDGREVRIICENCNSSLFPIVAEVQGGIKPESFTNEGKYRSGFDSDLDLFFITEKHEGWVNVYRAYASGNMSAGHIFDTEEDAKHNADIDDIATVKIEWEE